MPRRVSHVNMANWRILVYVVLGGSFLSYTTGQSCHDIGDQKVIYDPSCANGGVGCNAGGQGQLCRFCFAVPDLCTASATATSAQASSSTKGSTSSGRKGKCQPVDGRQTFYDPSCSQCNAGGVLDCRFCDDSTGANCSAASASTAKASSANVPTTTLRSTTTTTSVPLTSTMGPVSRCTNSKTALQQTSCTADETATCQCLDGYYCCLDGQSSVPVHGCNPVPWVAPACSCACRMGTVVNPSSPSSGLTNCTYEQYMNNWCDLTLNQHFYCPSTGQCQANTFQCADLCWIPNDAPVQPRPVSNSSFVPSNDMIPQNAQCGAQTEIPLPKCDVQPNNSSWPYKPTRDGECQGTYTWCPSGEGFIPSKYQCGAPIMNTPVCPLRTTLQSQQCTTSTAYIPPKWAPQSTRPSTSCDTASNDVCDGIHDANHCVGCCQATQWPWTQSTGCASFWSENPHGGACRQVAPRFNWIITTCDTGGGIIFAGACHQNPFSRVDVRYIAGYQLTKTETAGFVWSLVKESSANWDGQNKYVDFSALPTESTGTGPINSCSGGGGGWNTAFFPYKVDGLSPPAFMMVLSYERFENAAWFMLNQKILNNGPGESTCKDMTNCWGEISAGEIDFLESPNLFPENFRTSKGWNIFHTTSYNAANRCFACNHGFQSNGSLNQPGCGGAPANTYYDSNDETDATAGHIWVAVIDARGTTLYKDPDWPGLTASCASEQLLNLHPKQPVQQQACKDPTKSCAIFLPSCVTNVTPEMVQLTGGDYSRIPYCYHIDAANHVTCTQNWWDLMMDTGQWVIQDPGNSDLN